MVRLGWFAGALVFVTFVWILNAKDSGGNPRAEGSPNAIGGATNDRLASEAIDDDDGPSNPKLHDEMEKLRSALRKLRRALRADDQKAAALQALVEAQLSVHRSKVMAPVSLEGKSDADKAQGMTAYRQQMIGVARQLLDCESRLLAGDLAGARKVREQLKKLEKAGHEKFRD